MNADNEIFGFDYMDCCEFVAASLPLLLFVVVPIAICDGCYESLHKFD